jgi:hypothetical protein
MGSRFQVERIAIVMEKWTANLENFNAMMDKRNSELSNKLRHRPLFRVILLMGLALFSLNGWLRMAGSIAYWYWWSVANIQPGPLYLLISGMLWGAAGLAALVWIALRRPHYRLVGMAAALMYAVTYWADRLLIRNPETNLPNIIFAALFTLLALIFVWFVLHPLPELQAIIRQPRK